MSTAETELLFSVSDFVAVVNQTLEFAYPNVLVQGEVANFKVSKNKWVYFDLKDEAASVRCFGTVFQLPAPLEDGMVVQVRAVPRLHQLYGFSLNIQRLQPAGEGSIRKAADLLTAKLAAEGLFDESRKRSLPYPPQRIGLITSGESAAYADFTKILAARWQGIAITHVDVQVQGELAPVQITSALRQLNELAEPPEVIVLIRGGGSADDLQAFSHEQVVRAVAASRVPTLVAIGHEVDTSLAELAADQHASTPSNAAELLVPDRAQVLRGLAERHKALGHALRVCLDEQERTLHNKHTELRRLIAEKRRDASDQLAAQAKLLAALNPSAILARGYAIVRHHGQVVRQVAGLTEGAHLSITLADGVVAAKVVPTTSEANKNEIPIK